MPETSNRQLVARRRGATGATAELGVVWGRGALEERVEDAGALALVLTALARELERPVRAGAGRTAEVRVETEVAADSCEIRLTGPPELVRAAVQRLPLLFERPLIAEGLMPLRQKEPRWCADLLTRTGVSGYAVQGLRGLGTGARHAARRKLRELDVRRGTVNCLLWTDDESLLDAVDGLAPLRTAPHEPAWADGSPRWRPGDAPGQDDGNRPALLAAGRLSRELFSVMVPRTREGRAAAELLRIALAEALVAVGEEHEMIDLEAQGMGEGVRVVLCTHTPLRQERRTTALSELLRRIGLLPDSWISAVLHRTTSPARFERGRRVRGLGPEPEASVDGVRKALTGARRSIHLAVDPQSLDFAAHPQLSAMPALGPAREDARDIPRVFTVSRRGKRRGGSDPSTRVRLTRSTLAVEHGIASSEPSIVDLGEVVAVIDSPSGARQLIDSTGSTVMVRTADLEDGRQLETYLAHRLARVPRLLREDQGPALHPGVLKRRRSLETLLAVGVMGGLLLLFGVLPALDEASDETSAQEAWSRLDPAWGETVELSNGTRITASDPVEEGDVQRLSITFCGGEDAEGLGRDGEEADEKRVQNTVSPDHFTLYSDSGAALPLVEGPAEAEDLPSDQLADGECVTGDLRFENLGQAGDGLVYDSSFGDRVIWKDR